MSFGTAAYRPFGMLMGMAGGMLAGKVFDQVWQKVRHEDNAPDPLDAERSWTEVLLAAAVQGAVFAVVRAIVDRGGAKGYEEMTGVWPGEPGGRK